MSTYTAARSNQNTTPARPGNGSADNGTIKVYTSILTTRTPVLQPTTGNGADTNIRADDAPPLDNSGGADSGIDTTMLLGIAAVGGALLLRKKKKRK